MPYAWNSYHVLIERIRNSEVLGFLAIAFSDQIDKAEYIDVAQNMAFVSMGREGVYVFDLINTDTYNRHTLIHAFPGDQVYDQNPIISSHSSTEDITVIDDLIYIAGTWGSFGTGLGIWGSDLTVFDITELPQPEPVVLASESFLDITAMPLEQPDNHIVISDEAIFFSIDVSNPADPIANVVETYYSSMGGTLVNAKSLASTGQTLFAADRLGNLFAINMQNPANPSIVDQSIVGTSEIVTMEAKGTELHLMDRASMLHIYDISDPTNMQPLGSLNLSGKVSITSLPPSIALANGLAFVGSTNDIYKIDVSNPSSPVHISSLETRGYVHDIALDLPVLYVADGSKGFSIYREDQFVFP